MPIKIKQLMTVNPPVSPTEWLMVATRLMKTHARKPEQNTFRQNVSIRPRQNTSKAPLVQHFQHEQPPYPCSICTQQGIPNAYHWKQQCLFNQHQLKQTPFTWDSSLATNTVSQSSENSVNCQQIPNQRQHPSTETCGPAY
ncbi:uncharacterized protein TNCV_2128061 [Trichonephila clavipes]|nr:uncharacterized protein TNCV_2128061 [Trichonephila clavipes]